MEKALDGAREAAVISRMKCGSFFGSGGLGSWFLGDAMGSSVNTGLVDVIHCSDRPGNFVLGIVWGCFI